MKLSNERYVQALEYIADETDEGSDARGGALDLLAFLQSRTYDAVSADLDSIELDRLDDEEDTDIEEDEDAE